MAELVQALQHAVSAAFVALGLASLGDWLVHRERRRGWLAAALGSLGLVALLGMVGRRLPIPSQLSVVALLASGYALVRFRDAFLPLSRSARTAVSLTIAAVVLLAVIGLPSQRAPAYTPAQMVVLWIVIAAWALCVGEPAVRFWLAARGRPAVQRARLRALSAGYAGIVLVLLLAATSGGSGGRPAVTVLLDLVALATVPALYVSFAPPRWLRQAWWRSEDASYIRATRELVLLGGDRASLAARALDWGVRMLGAEGGLVTSGRDHVLAASGLSPHAARELAARVSRLDGSAGAGPMGDDRLLVVPLAPGSDAVQLALVAGPFTPVFGSEEVARLEEYSLAVGLAMERVRLLEDLARQQALHETLLRSISDMGEGLVLFRAGRLTYANEAYQRLTGRDLRELGHLSDLTELVVPEDRARVRELTDPMLAGETVSVQVETRLVAGDGRHVDVEAVGRSLTIDGAPASVAIIRDVSERKQAVDRLRASEERSRQLAEELAQRVAERTAANQELEAFTYTVSHDLRAPLRAIDGFVAALMEDHYADLGPDAREHLDDVAANARQMSRLIDDLLAFSRLSGRLPNRCQVRPGTLAREALAPLRAELDDRRAAVRIGRLPACDADPVLLGQVYANLLSNAVKYTRKKNGRTQIEVGHTRQSGQIVYYVRDNGIGFDPAYRDKLFGVFQRLHGDDDYDGTGVGLAIVQRIVERHGGRVWAEGRPEEGATFFFTVAGGGEG